MVRVWVTSQSLLFILLLVSITGNCKEQVLTLSSASDLRQQINSVLYRLPLEHQGKYALMLYRTTGNKDYLETARVSLYLSADRLQHFAANLRKKHSRYDQVEKEDFSLPADMIKSYSDYLFYGFMVLPNLLRINQFAMTLKGQAGDKLDQVMNGYDFKQGLTSAELIPLHGPRLAEHVYGLLSLDYGDYRTPFINTLQRVYPDDSDAGSSRQSLLNKWETLAQLVIAASDQLQEPVNDPFLSWIPEYFLKNRLLVLEQGSPVVFAKIGLALYLTGKEDSVLLGEIIKKVSATSTRDEALECRFWTMLLLDWQENYFPDPAIYRMDRFKNKVPFTLKPLD